MNKQTIIKGIHVGPTLKKREQHASEGYIQLKLAYSKCVKIEHKTRHQNLKILHKKIMYTKMCQQNSKNKMRQPYFMSKILSDKRVNKISTKIHIIKIEPIKRVNKVVYTNYSKKIKNVFQQN